MPLRYAALRVAASSESKHQWVSKRDLRVRAFFALIYPDCSRFLIGHDSPPRSEADSPRLQGAIVCLASYLPTSHDCLRNKGNQECTADRIEATLSEWVFSIPHSSEKVGEIKSQ